jgi:outer membrane protein assembly factor BamB
MMRATLLVLTTALALPARADDKDAGWSQWRGPKRDGLSPDTGLLREWPAGGPKLAWKSTGIGEGYSSISLLNDRIYTMGDQGDACNLVALNAADGKVVWQSKVGAPQGHNKYPGPRATPSTDGKLVITLGQQGDLVCFEAESGKEKWRKSLERDFDGKMMSGWRYSESPLLDGDLVVCTPGGPKGTVVALKKDSGEIAWRSTDLTDPAAYTSLVPVEIDKVRQYLLLTSRSAAGIAAKDGKVLWRADRSGKTAVITTPVFKDGLMFVTSSYGVGCNAFKITSTGGMFKAEEVYSGKQLENHHGGVILLGDHLYATDNRGLKCLELKTGKVVWEDRCVGKGSVAYADGHLVVRGEKPGKGEVALVEASPAGYKETGRFSPPDQGPKENWAHPVVFGGKLYLRDQDSLLCYDVKAK